MHKSYSFVLTFFEDVLAVTPSMSVWDSTRGEFQRSRCLFHSFLLSDAVHDFIATRHDLAEVYMHSGEGFLAQLLSFFCIP